MLLRCFCISLLLLLLVFSFVSASSGLSLSGGEDLSLSASVVVAVRALPGSIVFAVAFAVGSEWYEFAYCYAAVCSSEVVTVSVVCSIMSSECSYFEIESSDGSDAESCVGYEC